MKQLLRLFFVMALVFGSAHSGRAQGFHMKVLDPANLCSTNPSLCKILDVTAPFPVTFTANTCVVAGVTGLPSNPATYGCLLLDNRTGNNITSLNMTFPGLGSLPFTCDTTGPGVLFTGASCTSSGGIDTFYFYNGILGPEQEAIIFESGADPGQFNGTGSLNTPEPAPFLLMLTGLLIAGLLFNKRETLYATARK